MLDMLTGPRGVNQTNEQENLWGVTVVQTTQLVEMLPLSVPRTNAGGPVT